MKCMCEVESIVHGLLSDVFNLSLRETNQNMEFVKNLTKSYIFYTQRENYD